MLKKILVALDGSPFSHTATAYALWLAGRRGAEVSGLAIIDEEIAEGQAVPLGGGHYATEVREKRLTDAQQRSRDAVEAFARAAGQAGVPHDTEVQQGAPFEIIVEAAKTADVTIIGLRTYFHYETQDEPGDTLRQVLKKSPSPIIAVPDKFTPISRWMVCWDKSERSSRALRSFLQMGCPEGTQAHIVMVGKDAESQEALAEGVEFLRSHDVEPKQELLSGSVFDALNAYAQAEDIDLLVLGAYGGSPIREWLFGGTTQSFIKDGRRPLFLHH